MTKVLLKKQMMEVFAWVYQDKKSGKNRGKSGVILYIGLYLIIFGILGFIFFQVGDMLAPLIDIGYGWLFMALMSLISVALGVFGSVFNTYATLYQAKDNDFLLSMPVPTSTVLMARLSGVYAMGLMYGLIVMIPTVIVFLMHSKTGILGTIFTLLIPLVLSIFVLTVSCILGWIVAVISQKLKHKNIITVIVSIAFIAAYYYVYGQAYTILQEILKAPESLAKKVKSILYPFYHMGLASEGNVVSMLIFTGIILAMFAIVYMVLSRGFIKLATSNRGTTKIKYKEKVTKCYSVNRALFRKEMKRFLGSTTYMLNCGLGIVIMVVIAVVILIKGDSFVGILYELFGTNEGFLEVMVCGAVCMSTSMNDITAPSVSLEGKNIWLSQVFPISGWQVLKAKIHLHLALTLAPTFLLVASILWILKPRVIYVVLIPVICMLFVWLMAQIGLVLNLKMPNLNWTNEMIPVKQSMGVMITLFGGWIIAIAIIVVYYLLLDMLNPVYYLTGVAALLLVISLALMAWLRKRGAEIFEKL